VLPYYERSQLQLHRSHGRLRQGNGWRVAKHSLWTSSFRRKRRAVLTAAAEQWTPLVWSWRTKDRNRRRVRRTAAVRARCGRRRCTRTATRRRTRPAPRKRTTKRFSWCARACVRFTVRRRTLSNGT